MLSDRIRLWQRPWAGDHDQSKGGHYHRALSCVSKSSLPQRPLIHIKNFRFWSITFHCSFQHPHVGTCSHAVRMCLCWRWSVWCRCIYIRASGASLCTSKSQLAVCVHALRSACDFRHCHTATSCTQPLICIMSLSMADNWAQRQLVSMKAPVLFWQKQQRKSSLEKAALCREGNGAELLPCSLAAIDQRLSCCATPTTAHILPLPRPEINTKGKKVESARQFALYNLFFLQLFWYYFRVTLFRYYSPGTHSSPFNTFLISIWTTTFSY